MDDASAKNAATIQAALDRSYENDDLAIITVLLNKQAGTLAILCVNAAEDEALSALYTGAEYVHRSLSNDNSTTH